MSKGATSWAQEIATCQPLWEVKLKWPLEDRLLSYGHTEVICIAWPLFSVGGSRCEYVFSIWHHCVSFQQVNSGLTLSDLPLHMLNNILYRFSDGWDIVTLGQVTPTLYMLSEDRRLWKKLCQYHFAEKQVSVWCSTIESSWLVSIQGPWCSSELGEDMDSISRDLIVLEYTEVASEFPSVNHKVHFSYWKEIMILKVA